VYNRQTSPIYTCFIIFVILSSFIVIVIFFYMHTIWFMCCALLCADVSVPMCWRIRPYMYTVLSCCSVVVAYLPKTSVMHALLVILWKLSCVTLSLVTVLDDPVRFYYTWIVIQGTFCDNSNNWHIISVFVLKKTNTKSFKKLREKMQFSSTTQKTNIFYLIYFYQWFIADDFLMIPCIVSLHDVSITLP